MNFKLYSLFVSVLCSTLFVTGQKPLVKWSKTYSESGNSFYSIEPTRDKGFFIGGADSSIYAGSANEKGIYGVPSIRKLDSNGNEIWRNILHYGDPVGGITSIKETNDGGCITAGFTGSIYVRGVIWDTALFMITKFSSLGVVEWDKKLGGSKADRANSIVQTDDDGYLAVGYAGSNDGDITGFHYDSLLFTKDAWVIKLDVDGNVMWKKCYGGFKSDIAEAVVKTIDNAFIIAGSSLSSDGDLLDNKGGFDGWLFKIDSTGNILWQKNIGGTGMDQFKSIEATSDGNYIATGYTTSNDNDVTGNHGGSDMWVVKIDRDGNIIWSKCLGGSKDDIGISVKATFNDILVAGSTLSNDGNVAYNNGNSDMWILKLSSSGNIVWEETALKNQNEYMGEIAFISESDYIIAGWSDAGYPNYPSAIVVRFGNANTIKGNVFIDDNLNGIKDPEENSFDSLDVKVEKNGIVKSLTPYNGRFLLDVDTGTYKTYINYNASYYNLLPVSLTSVFDSYFDTDSVSFALQPIPGIKDIGVSIIALGATRPGFVTKYKILYYNAGTQVIPSGTVRLIKHDISYFSTYPNYSYGNVDTIAWNFTNLFPSDTGSIDLSLRMHFPPDGKIGDTINLYATISPLAGDVLSSNDTFRLRQIAVGSFDPNDKTESHGGTISRDEINLGGYLNYTIRFQNTGTDTAFNVNIKDTLSDKLDWSTFRMISASHVYDLHFNDQNKLEWNFNDIKLINKNVDEPGSRGYLSFSIKTKNTIAANDVILNTASIYFDFNLPIRTNTERTIVLQAVVLPVKLSEFSARLMPQGLVAIKWKTSFEANSDYYEVQRSKDGVSFEKISTVRSRNLATGSSYTISDLSPLNGANYYRLRSVDKDGTSAYSAIELINKNNATAILATLYPNPSGGDITLKLAGNVKGNISFSITDVSGISVYQKDLGYLSTDKFTTPLDVSRFSKGTYVVTFVVEGKIYTRQLIIQ